MKICVIEDSPQKLEKILTLLKFSLPNINITSLGSYQSGLKYIKAENPELVILDMTLPTFDRGAGKREGRMRPFGGEDVMRKMQLNNIQSKVIVVTQFSSFDDGDEKVDYKTLFTRCKIEFKGLFIEGIKYSHSSDDWMNELSSIINKVK
ncbi:response regulator [Vibrio fluvialis]|uniref:response regulator n=1 Tax=Vibrio fluvialis TaxID=676 RepID=UPI001EEB6941|nr:response regulator [Vibrio fluvialis]MCG6398902.1 response regulator [Vibrio fluvialis]